MLAAISLLTAGAARAQLSTQSASARLFVAQCSGCHGNPAVPRAPSIETLRQLSAETIYLTLTTGLMRIQAAELSDDSKLALTRYITGHLPGLDASADARSMSDHCVGSPAFAGLSTWNGFGGGIENTRFQPMPGSGLTIDGVRQLALRWAFGFPGASVVYSQPTLVGGRVFVSVDTGYVYALDASSGCVYWSYRAHAGVRTPIVIGPGPAGSSAAYFGDIQGRVYSVDVEHGMLLWESIVDAHPAARITAAPVLWRNRLYVPVSSMEEGLGADAHYACCSFRGSIVALDALSGRRIWKTYVIPKPAQNQGKNALGTPLLGPAGGAVWGTPAIDTRSHRLYLGTGDAYRGPAPETTDALLALDLSQGRIVWVAQHTADDAWIARCEQVQGPNNCPRPLGPDSDFGAGPLLIPAADGHMLLIAAQKNGYVFAHDLDDHGRQRWSASLASSQPDPKGELVWGGATDGKQVYYGLNSGSLAAIRIEDGVTVWRKRIDPPSDRASYKAQGGPITAIPGVIFSGGLDGFARAFASESGELLWEFDTVRDFSAVNGVMAHGGSLGAAGITVAAGLVLVPSGNIGIHNGMQGNVLLAFAAQ
jgi:polyvinyl alcohol dehydrogenase (cytochrome)